MKYKKILPAVILLSLGMMACQFTSRLWGAEDKRSALPTLAPVSSSAIPMSAVNPNLAADQDLLVRLYDTVSPGVVLIQQVGDTGSGLGSVLSIARMVMWSPTTML